MPARPSDRAPFSPNAPPDAPLDAPTAILVLGMHRSGTSALTGALDLFGARTPRNQIAAGAQNAKGFFEATPVARLNDSLLDQRGLTWDSWAPMAPVMASDMPDLKTRAREIIAEEFGPASLIALKDPRICRLAPFWIDVLQQMSYQPRVLITLRHPMEVARSLQVRNGFALEKGLLLWLVYVLDSEASTRRQRRMLTSFDQIMQSPEAVLAGCAAHLGLRFPAEGAAARAALAAFLSPDLRHHTEEDSPEQPARLPQPLAEVYAILMRWTREGETSADYARLDQIRARVKAVAAIEGPDETPGREEMVFETMSLMTSDPAELPLGKLRKEALLEKTQGMVRAMGLLQGEVARAEQSARAARDGLARRDADLSRLAALYVETQARADTAEADLDGIRRSYDENRKALIAAEAALSDLQKAHGVLEPEAARLAGENTELHALVARVETERARLAGEAGELHALVARVETERARLAGENGELHALVARVETERARLAGENTELHALVAEVERRRQAFEHSTSWRLTRPLRALARLFGRR